MKPNIIQDLAVKINKIINSIKLDTKKIDATIKADKYKDSYLKQDAINSDFNKNRKDWYKEYFVKELTAKFDTLKADELTAIKLKELITDYSFSMYKIADKLVILVNGDYTKGLNQKIYESVVNGRVFTQDLENDEAVKLSDIDVDKLNSFIDLVAASIVAKVLDNTKDFRTETREDKFGVKQNLKIFEGDSYYKNAVNVWGKVVKEIKSRNDVIKAVNDLINKQTDDKTFVKMLKSDKAINGTLAELARAYALTDKLDQKQRQKFHDSIDIPFDMKHEDNCLLVRGFRDIKAIKQDENLVVNQGKLVSTDKDIDVDKYCAKILKVKRDTIAKMFDTIFNQAKIQKFSYKPLMAKLAKINNFAETGHWGDEDEDYEDEYSNQYCPDCGAEVTQKNRKCPECHCDLD